MGQVSRPPQRGRVSFVRVDLVDAGIERVLSGTTEARPSVALLGLTGETHATDTAKLLQNRHIRNVWLK